MQGYASLAILLVIACLVFAVWRLRTKRSMPGPAAAGMMSEILNDDRRAAIEVIVEEKTGYRDPEDRDGNCSDLKDQSVIRSGKDH
jgi:hypothetical protein